MKMRVFYDFFIPLICGSSLVCEPIQPGSQVLIVQVTEQLQCINKWTVRGPAWEQDQGDHARVTTTKKKKKKTDTNSPKTVTSRYFLSRLTHQLLKAHASPKNSACLTRRFFLVREQPHHQGTPRIHLTAVEIRSGSGLGMRLVKECMGFGNRTIGYCAFHFLCCQSLMHCGKAKFTAARAREVLHKN